MFLCHQELRYDPQLMVPFGLCVCTRCVDHCDFETSDGVMHISQVNEDGASGNGSGQHLGNFSDTEKRYIAVD